MTATTIDYELVDIEASIAALTVLAERRRTWLALAETDGSGPTLDRARFDRQAAEIEAARCIGRLRTLS